MYYLMPERSKRHPPHFPQFLEVELKAGAPVAMLIANENIARRSSEFVVEDCRVYFCSTATDKA